MTDKADSDDQLDVTVRDNPDAHRFEIVVGEQIAFLQYQRKQNAIVLVHVEVPPPLQGRGLSNVLAKSALEAARTEGLRVIAQCPVVRAYLRKHPEFETLLA